MLKARVEKLHIGPGRRILAVSDIHGNLPYLRGLLERCALTRDDTLLILGDMVEKGRDSLETLRYIMELGREYDVHALCGNCDGWHGIFEGGWSDNDEMLRRYILGANGWSPGLVAQMCAEAGIDAESCDMRELRPALAGRFKAEFDFLRSLPTIIDAGDYVFVHGGLPDYGPLDELPAGRCMKDDDFMSQGMRFERWVIVGHWPVVLYSERVTDARPRIDRESRIISIDGGCVLKDDGQLNALVIPEYGSEEFSHIAYDPFPVRRALSAQAASEDSYYIRWGDNRVRVLERGGEFSLVEHLRTGRRMEVLTGNLLDAGEISRCNDSTDYVLPVSPGDALSVVRETSRGALCKKDGVSGWYFGELGVRS